MSVSSMPCACAHGMIASGSRVISAVRNGRRSPCTTACEMYWFCFRPFSRFAGVMFYPPAVMMMSFLRPVM